ncbi:MAG: single-strand binding protein [Gammaproteobacteria bacterium]|jgi:single-strand DNA-binding protein|nr:single-strand binding protein [Gammaproteobacteria bacterium]
MSSLNQAMLIANLGQDPEVLKESELGSFVRLSVATNKKFKTKEGELREETEWHAVYLNGNLGKVAATSLKKGAKVFVSGELRTREWQDKEGQVHLLTAIYAKEIKFLSPKLPEYNDGQEFPHEHSTDKKAEQEIDEIVY